jgi:hypothetical protein
MLFGAASTHVAVMFGVRAGLVGVAALASYLPARRAFPSCFGLIRFLSPHLSEASKERHLGPRLWGTSRMFPTSIRLFHLQFEQSSRPRLCPISWAMVSIRPTAS